jgi:hypothetical protein
MNLSINTIVKLKVTGYKAFKKTEKKPAGCKLQARYSREEGGLSQFEIKVFDISEVAAKSFKNKTIQLENCSVFRPDQEYAPSYWNSLSQPTEIRESISKPVINTIITGTVEAIEPFSGEKMSGFSLYFVDNTNDAETIYNVKIQNLDEAVAKSYLNKDVKIEQCKPLSKISYITEEKPTPISHKIISQKD